MMIRYTEEDEYPLRSLWFDYCGVRYKGSGTLKWKHRDGFRLEGYVSPVRNAPPSTRTIRRNDVLRDDDFCNIRMKPYGCDYAIAPRVRVDPLVDYLRLRSHHQPPALLGTVIFFHTLSYTSDRSGEALYESTKTLHLPGRVQEDLRIDGELLTSSYSLSGILHNDALLRLIGRTTEDSRLHFTWQDSGNEWATSHSWRWPVALGQALSILSGQTVSLVKREMRHGTALRTELRPMPRPARLRLFAPFPEDILWQNKSILVDLAKFLARDDLNARVCYRIFERLADASQQRSRHAAELLVGTTLEAILRTHAGLPFQTTGRRSTFDVEKTLIDFTSDATDSTAWRRCRRDVYSAFRRLRHRNAHPDWLSSTGGGESAEILQQSVDDMSTLSAFYGQVILKLAGLQNYQPFSGPPYLGTTQIGR